MVMKTKTQLPQVGAKAPDFSAPTHESRTVRLSDFNGKVVVLYFYPRDNTPGCTTEACGFRDGFSSYLESDIVVLGISPDSPDSHREFIKSQNLPFTLLSDESHAIAEQYGVWREKTMGGASSMGIMRTTFVIDPDGKIAHVFEDVKPEGHERQVFEWISANLM